MNGKRGNYVLAFVLFSITLLYGIFQGRALIHGPILTIESPQQGATVTSTLFEIRGTTRNVTHVEINGQPITMDTEGTFRETLITPHGYGLLLIEATNRFGHHKTERVEFYGTPPTTSKLTLSI
jgi:hypothetical protein